MTDTSPNAAGAARTPSSTPVLRRVLLFGAALTVVVAVVGAILGGILAGGEGIVSALVGAILVLLLVSVTSGSILIANRFFGSPSFAMIFFGIVLGAWLLKFVLFLAAVLLLRDQPWLDPMTLFLTIVGGLLGSLVVDVVVVLRARLPYVSDAAEH
ncbi:hypothetical protein [Herbiconiux sp. L3-i23]|uniref:hypothetical protein n=1 Tax=Herbiconiux sp. L3-i23 TaxID=2905871 RepID=UPI0020620D46|nr:hypothetical protein [Herbiconiux sp. L3-i23]BDI22005.1 hypothetical protein L3i23_07810 [Herbiconiux sp. L3-i23]